MKTTKIILLIAIIAIPLLNSCKKEDYSTNGEQIGKELNELISTQKIKCVEVRQYYSLTSYEYMNSKYFEISGSFIKVGEYSYALENLSNYYINTINYQGIQLKCLFLNFK